MNAINTHSSPHVPKHEQPGAEGGRPSRPGRSALSILAAVSLMLGCAGELEKDPGVFTNAFGDTPGTTGGTTGTTGGTTSTGGTTGTTGGTTGTTGGTTSTGGTSSVPADDPCVAMVLTAQNCKLCHTGAAEAGGHLSLDGSNLGARLSMTKATYYTASNPTACVPNALIIDPVNPADSVLLKKVKGTQACGTPMPFAPGLSGTDLKCFEDWIAKF